MTWGQFNKSFTILIDKLGPFTNYDAIYQTRGSGVFDPISKHQAVGWKKKKHKKSTVLLTDFVVLGNRMKYSSLSSV